MINFPYCVDKGLPSTWRFPDTGSKILDTLLPPYTRCSSFDQVTAFYHDMDILTSYGVLLLSRAATGFMENFELCVRGHIFGCYIARFAVYSLASALLLCPFK